MEDLIFRSERLKLRPLKKEDIALVHHMHSFPEVLRFGTINAPKTLLDTRNLLSDALSPQNDRHFGWSIRDNHTDEFIGEMGLHLAAKKFKMGEVHYGLLPAFWGKGYATEALQTLLKGCFQTLKLHRIEAGVAVDNIGSIGVLEKAGMIREGRKRKVLPIRGEWVDNFHFAILSEDLH